MIEYDELTSESIGFVEVLGREQYRRSTFNETLDDAPEILSTLRIEPRRWFIEKEDGRIGDEGRREVESATHAARIRLGDAIRRVTETEIVE